MHVLIHLRPQRLLQPATVGVSLNCRLPQLHIYFWRTLIFHDIVHSEKRDARPQNDGYLLCGCNGGQWINKLNEVMRGRPDKCMNKKKKGCNNNMLVSQDTLCGQVEIMAKTLIIGSFEAKSGAMI